MTVITTMIIGMTSFFFFIIVAISITMILSMTYCYHCFVVISTMSFSMTICYYSSLLLLSRKYKSYLELWTSMASVRGVGVSELRNTSAWVRLYEGLEFKV